MQSSSSKSWACSSLAAAFLSFLMAFGCSASDSEEPARCLLKLRALIYSSDFGCFTMKVGFALACVHPILQLIPGP